jgi:hypothetical protein
LTNKKQPTTRWRTPPPPLLANNQHIKLPSFSTINIISCFAMAEEERAVHVAADPGQSGQGGRAIREPCPCIKAVTPGSRTHQRFLCDTGAACFTLHLLGPAGQFIDTRTMAVITANGECSPASAAKH